MERVLEILKQTRSNFIKMIDSLSLEQVNKVPEGYNNSVVWNFAHGVVTQQLLCYKIAGEEMLISDELVNKYRKGTKHEVDVSQDELNELKSLAFSLLDQFEKDLAAGNKFKNYTPYETSYGVTLSSSEEAIAFENIHEGVHFGYALSLKKHI